MPWRLGIPKERIMHPFAWAAVVAAAAALATPVGAEEIRYFPVGLEAGLHDVAPSPGANGPVWFTEQRRGALGRLDPGTGKITQITLGEGSAPHGVIIGPDGAPWITDGGHNAIVRVDPGTLVVKAWPLPAGHPSVDLNTATFDKNGLLWFTGQAGVFGRLDPRTGQVTVWDAPKGSGPYGMRATADGSVYFASLAGSYLGRIDPTTGQATVIEPPTSNQGARRVWPDSAGRVWVSEWNAGQVSRYDPTTNTWQSWKLPGDHPHAYGIYVDEHDQVWLSDWGSNALVRFDPQTQRFISFPSDRPRAEVRQLMGRPGEVWGAESGTGRLVRITTP
jgi:virginiamycin B lyase